MRSEAVRFFVCAQRARLEREVLGMIVGYTLDFFLSAEKHGDALV